jgi:SnoaL-like domain
MTTTEEIVLAYIDAWSETDVGKRRALLEKSWAENGTYTDPTVEVEGQEALVQHIAGIHQRFVDCRILLTSRVDEHHGRLRFTWAMVNPEGSRVSEGIDFGEVGSDNRLIRITGFFGLTSTISH